MADLTPSHDLFGIGIPYAVTITGARGTDYTEAPNLRAGPFVPDADTVVRLEALGDVSSDSITEVQVAKAGTSKPGSGGLVFRENNGSPDNWFGRDGASIHTGYQGILGSGTYAEMDLIEMRDGSVALIYENTDSDVRFRLRDAATGSWGSGVDVANLGFSGTTYPACGFLNTDGSLWAYAFNNAEDGTANEMSLMAWRSTDNGTTWEKQSSDVLGTTYTDSTIRRVRAVAQGGDVLILVTDNTGTSSTLDQYVSTDGGGTATKIGGTHPRMTAWDAVELDGFVYVVTIEYNGSTQDQTYVRRMGRAREIITNADQVDVDTSSALHTDPWALCVTDDGIIHAAQASTGLNGYTSEDYGETWVQNGIRCVLGGIYIDEHALAFWHGSVLQVGIRSAASGGMVEHRFGGGSDVTLGPRWLPSFNDRSYIPTDSLVNMGWAIAGGETGFPARTLSLLTGQNIITGAGDIGQHLFTGSGADHKIARVVAKADSGAVAFRITSAGTTKTMTVSLTSTGIRAYDYNGTPPSYTTHSITGYLDILMYVDDSGSGNVWYREYEADPPYEDYRLWTHYGTVGGITTSGTAHEFYITVANSSDVHILEIGYGSTETSIHNGDLTRPDELEPVPLSVRPVFTRNNVFVRHIQGQATVDGVTHTSTPVSDYKLSHVLPRGYPSPQVAWRSDGVAGDEHIDLALDQSDQPGCFEIWLDGLIGVSSVKVVAHSSTTTHNLAHTFTYDAIGSDAVVPSYTGSDAASYWLMADELKGGYFKDSAGTVRAIVGNSEGTLTEGASIESHRAKIYLDDTVTGTNVTGTIYPPRAVIRCFTAENTTLSTIALEIDAASQFTPPEGYREIGLAAVCKVYVAGVPPDLNDDLDVLNNAEIQTLRDGQRFSARTSANRKVYRWGWTRSGDQEKDLIGSERNPNYVTFYSGGARVAARDGYGFTMESVLARAGDHPVLVDPAIPAQSSAGRVAQTFGLRCLWSRIVSGVRREGIPLIGERGASQVYRVPTLTAEQEL